MKTNKIIYWIATILIAGLFLMSSVMYLTHNPMLVQGFHALGYPPFILNLLGTAKLIGTIALLQPWAKTLREWAYAGFYIVLTGATWTHLATGTPFIMPLVFMVLLTVSYVFYRRLGAISVIR